MARGDVTIRWSLLRNLLALIALLSGSILTVTFVLAKETVRRLSSDLVGRTIDRTEAELDRFFEPVADQLRMARAWSLEGLLRCTDANCLNTLLPPIMTAVPQISSVNTGDGEGRGVLLLRDAGGWRNREVWRESDVPKVRWTRLDVDLVPLETWMEDLDYDPRQRPWYTGAVHGSDASRIHWTAPYTFKTTKDPGITASVQAVGAGGLPFVLAFDVLLKDLSAFTTNLEVSPNGIAFVLGPDGRVVGLPRAERWGDPAALQAAILQTADALGIPSLGATVAAARAAGLDRAGTFDFEVEGERWWAGYRPLRLAGGPTLAIGVAVPEEDFLGDVRRQRLLILLLTTAALAVSLVLSVLMARHYSRPLEELAEQSERLKNLDTREVPFTPSHLREVSRLHAAQESMRGALDSFARYVPTEVVRDLLRRGEAARIGGRTEELTVLFTDIEGFTSVSEGLDPAELTAHMAEYFDVMLRTIREHGGTIDKLIGDAIVAFWNAPNPVSEHPRRAVEAVIACRERLAVQNAAWTGRGRPALPTRFGLTTGRVVVGNVGTASRLHYTVLGDTVNLASRLEGANKQYGTYVLAEETTMKRAGEGFVWRRLDRVAVKGRAGAVEVFELVGRLDATDAARQHHVARYEEALAHYQAARFDAALTVLRTLDEDGSADAAAQRLVHLCRRLRSAPPPRDWDGVVHLSQK